MRQGALVPRELLLSYLEQANEERKARLKFINQCAPLIKGLKPSTFLMIAQEQQPLWDRFFFEYGLQVSLLYYNKKQSSILIYDENRMKQCVLTQDRQQYLVSIGYRIQSLDLIFDQLSIRLKDHYEQRASFPHELGILLGYPVCDVAGFMHHGEALYSGYWKVYSNITETMYLFHEYDKARHELIMELLQKS